MKKLTFAGKKSNFSVERLTFGCTCGPPYFSHGIKQFYSVRFSFLNVRNWGAKFAFNLFFFLFIYVYKLLGFKYYCTYLFLRVRQHKCVHTPVFQCFIFWGGGGEDWEGGRWGGRSCQVLQCFFPDRSTNHEIVWNEIKRINRSNFACHCCVHNMHDTWQTLRSSPFKKRDY